MKLFSDAGKSRMCRTWLPTSELAITISITFAQPASLECLLIPLPFASLYRRKTFETHSLTFTTVQQIRLDLPVTAVADGAEPDVRKLDARMLGDDNNAYRVLTATCIESMRHLSQEEDKVRSRHCAG